MKLHYHVTRWDLIHLKVLFVERVYWSERSNENEGSANNTNTTNEKKGEKGSSKKKKYRCDKEEQNRNKTECGWCAYHVICSVSYRSNDAIGAQFQLTRIEYNSIRTKQKREKNRNTKKKKTAVKKNEEIKIRIATKKKRQFFLQQTTITSATLVYSVFFSFCSVLIYIILFLL